MYRNYLILHSLGDDHWTLKFKSILKNKKNLLFSSIADPNIGVESRYLRIHNLVRYLKNLSPVRYFKKNHNPDLDPDIEKLS